jgi:hypothetical protein
MNGVPAASFGISAAQAKEAARLLAGLDRRRAAATPVSLNDVETVVHTQSGICPFGQTNGSSLGQVTEMNYRSSGLVGRVVGNIAGAATAMAVLTAAVLAMRKLKLVEKLTPITAAEVVSAVRAGRWPILPRGNDCFWAINCRS